MDNIKVLWVDDEIDLLKPHIMFLTAKGYDIASSNNGLEGIEMMKQNNYDIVFLDEQMPGLSGIETLSIIKSQFPDVPVVMITKSEEENIMEDAIGSSIADYLIKPVNPNQILLCLKKNLENRRLVSEKTSSAYQQEFRKISMELSSNLQPQEWIEIYKKIVFWELELEKSMDDGISSILKMQKDEANQSFSKYVERNYQSWFKDSNAEKPVMSHNLVKEKIFPLLDNNKTLVILIDNLRYDQWKIIQPLLNEVYRTEIDDMYFSILPSATQYARNALFSGLMPTQIDKKYPQYWVEESEEGTKNQFEEKLFEELLKRYGKNLKFTYHKVLNFQFGKKLADNFSNHIGNPLNIIVYNFVDMLSHAHTEIELIRELAENEAAYRSITLSWFEHSPLFDIIKQAASKGVNLIITTDHGSIKVDNPVMVKGDRNTTTNLRYKIGKMLEVDDKKVFTIKNPEEIYLKKINPSTSYIFCRNNDFFIYPNNYSQYVGYYKDTFQHGGISMEEMMIPFVFLTPR
ncbi:MAG: PglZ domain-containing protein [Bacteroidota bacterium]